MALAPHGGASSRDAGEVCRRLVISVVAMYVRHVGNSAYLNPIHHDGCRPIVVYICTVGRSRRPVTQHCPRHKPAWFFSHEHVLLNRQATKMESRLVSSSTQCDLTFAKAAQCSRYERDHRAVLRSACIRTMTKELPWVVRLDPGLEYTRYSLWGPEDRKGEVSEET
ncbi:hypothetical protein EV401DRAFT_1068311 [Pisolithus croceorrhizus]|nr:hypothetical protein EV401DRAFT_1068311 [Pisolithus croceorrhizus]